MEWFPCDPDPLLINITESGKPQMEIQDCATETKL